MAPVGSRLTLQEYDRLYGHQSGWEWWSGEAVPKPVLTFLHGLLAALLSDLLRLAGYITSVETDVRLADDWSPRPDVCGVLHSVEGKYPRSVDVVCEVLSEDEDILTECRHYEATGRVGQIFVFDAEGETVQVWNGSELMRTDDVVLQNGVTITGRRIWREMKARAKEAPAPGPLS